MAKKTLTKKKAQKSAVKKAAVKKPDKKPAKKAAAKPAKPAPAKKPVAKAKPASKAAPAPVKPKLNLKKPLKPEPKIAAKAEAAKAAVQEKAVAGKKAAPAVAETKGKAGAVKAEPIKVEPRIIETPQAEFVSRSPGEQLFSENDLDFFKDLLQSERNKILAKARKAVEEGNMLIDRNEMIDEVDQAAAMVEQNLTFRLLDRDRKLLSEIDHALGKIETGDYGYCEGTGEPIPRRRLELRPWCRHSVKFKEKLERMKKSGRGVADEDEFA